MKARWAKGDLLEVLACDINGRPAAPGPAELARFITRASLGSGALTLDIATSGRLVAEAFVAAEQVCCAGIGWELGGSPLKLRITAGGGQLKALAGLVPPTVVIENSQ